MLNKWFSFSKSNPPMTFKKMVLVFSFMAAGFAACKKDDDTDTPLPAYQIAASEKITIPTNVALPANLPGGNTRVATYYAEGVQQYKARVVAGSNPVQYEWVFVAPRADLYDATNQKVGTHGAGPYWALSPADSIFAQPFTPARTAIPHDENISWLQLMPKEGKTATGIFTEVDYIQRIATKGGIAPAVAPVSITDTAQVFYTAVYRFTKRN